MKGEGEEGSLSDRNSKSNFAQETYGTNLQVGWATAATSRIPETPRGKKALKKKPHNRFGLFKCSHPNKHLEDEFLNKHSVNLT